MGKRESKNEDFESLNFSKIGKGAFGSVYKVRRHDDKNVYASKVISKSMIIKKNLVDQIRLETEIQYKLNHPNILKLYDHYEDDKNIYLVLEYCPKGQLYELLQKK